MGASEPSWVYQLTGATFGRVVVGRSFYIFVHQDCDDSRAINHRFAKKGADPCFQLQVGLNCLVLIKADADFDDANGS